MFNKACKKKESKDLPRTLINRPMVDYIYLTFLTENFVQKYSSKICFM